MIYPFVATAKTLDISVTSTASTSTALPGSGNTIRIVNEGPNVCFVSIGSDTQTATVPATSNYTATCTPIMPGDTSLGIPATVSPLNISAICRSGQTARLSVQVGEGV